MAGKEGEMAPAATGGDTDNLTKERGTWPSRLSFYFVAVRYTWFQVFSLCYENP